MAISTGALLGAAGIAGVGSLLSGILGTSSQSSANKANIQMQRETNAQNYQMFKEQQAFTEDMWNKTNAYNDPSNQVKLLERAGINPAAVYGSGSTALASVPSSPTPSPMQSPTVNPVSYEWMGNIVDKGVDAYLNNNLLNNAVDKSKYDSQIAKVEAEFSAKTLMDRCVKTMNDAKASEFEKNIAKSTMEVMQATQNQNILQSKWSTKIMESNYNESINRIALSKLQQASLVIANQYAPAMNEAHLQSFKANIAAAYAAARASDAAALDSAASAALKDLQSEGQRISNIQASEIKEHIVSKAKFEANLAKENVYRAEDERFARPVDFYQRHLGKAANYTITPGSASAAAEMMDRNNKRDRFGSQHNERFRPKRNY